MEPNGSLVFENGIIFLSKRLRMKAKKENTEKLCKNYRVSEEQKMRIYFCPYCKMLYSDPVVKHQFKFNSHTSKFKCLSCNSPYFNNSTYNKLAKSKEPIHLKSRKYHLGKSVEEPNVRTQKKVNNLISNDILALKDKGFSNREIHQITHYSRHKVNTVVASRMTPETDEMSIEEFFKECLSSEPPVSKKEKINIVEKALEYGCPYSVIRQLVPMRKIEITNIAIRLGFEVESEKKVESEESEIEEKNNARKNMAINKGKRKIKIIDNGFEKKVVITTREKK